MFRCTFYPSWDTNLNRDDQASSGVTVVEESATSVGGVTENNKPAVETTSAVHRRARGHTHARKLDEVPVSGSGSGKGAPSAKAPSVKAPSAKAPSVKAPSAKAPSVKAPSAKAPSVKAPSAKAPSVKAPSAKAPSVKAPSSKKSIKIRRVR